MPTFNQGPSYALSIRRDEVGHVSLVPEIVRALQERLAGSANGQMGWYSSGRSINLRVPLRRCAPSLRDMPALDRYPLRPPALSLRHVGNRISLCEIEPVQRQIGSGSSDEIESASFNEDEGCSADRCWPRMGMAQVRGHWVHAVPRHPDVRSPDVLDHLGLHGGHIPDRRFRGGEQGCLWSNDSSDELQVTRRRNPRPRRCRRIP